MNDLLEAATTAENQLDLATACQQAISAWERSPNDRRAILQTARLLTGRGTQGALPEALCRLIRRNPWDFDACELLAEADPGVASRIAPGVWQARRSLAAPARPHDFSYDDFRHRRDQSVDQYVQSRPDVVTRLEEFHRRWTDSSIRRNMHVVHRVDGEERRVYRVSRGQMPDLWELHQETARRLNVSSVPDLFLVADDTVNGAAFGLTDPVIYIHSGLYKLLTDRKGRLLADEMMFVLGHEYGHKILRHSLIRAAAEDMVRNAASWGTGLCQFGDALCQPFRQAPSWGGFFVALAGTYVAHKGKGELEHARRLLTEIQHAQQFLEYGADRIGVCAAGSVQAGINVLAKLAGIHPEHRPFARIGLPCEFNLEEYLCQFDEAWRRLDLADPAEFRLTHPHLPFRIRSLQAWQLSRAFCHTLGNGHPGPARAVDVGDPTAFSA